MLENKVANMLQENRQRPGALQPFFATHPLTSERVEDARHRAAKLPDRRGLVTQDRQFSSIRRRAARYN